MGVTGGNSFVIDIIGKVEWRTMTIRTECEKIKFRFIEVQLPMVTPIRELDKVY